MFAISLRLFTLAVMRTEMAAAGTYCLLSELENTSGDR